MAKKERAAQVEENQAGAEEGMGQAGGRGGAGGELAIDPSVVEQITALLLLDQAAIEAYEIAIRACKAADINRQLKQFRDDHQRHVSELSEALVSVGAAPPEQPDERAQCIRSYTMMSALEDRTALVAMRGNEELTNGAYASALASELPDTLRQLVEANFRDERRHIQWITEEIRTRGWDLPEVPPELVVQAA